MFQGHFREWTRADKTQFAGNGVRRQQTICIAGRRSVEQRQAKNQRQRRILRMR